MPLRSGTPGVNAEYRTSARHGLCAGNGFCRGKAADSTIAATGGTSALLVAFVSATSEGCEVGASPCDAVCVAAAAAAADQVVLGTITWSGGATGSSATAATPLGFASAGWVTSLAMSFSACRGAAVKQATHAAATFLSQLGRSLRAAERTLWTTGTVVTTCCPGGGGGGSSEMAKESTSSP